MEALRQVYLVDSVRTVLAYHCCPVHSACPQIAAITMLPSFSAMSPAAPFSRQSCLLRSLQLLRLHSFQISTFRSTVRMLELSPATLTSSFSVFQTKLFHLKFTPSRHIIDQQHFIRFLNNVSFLDLGLGASASACSLGMKHSSETL